MVTSSSSGTTENQALPHNFASPNLAAPNGAALAAAAICGGATFFYGVLFYMISRLAGAQPDLSQLADETSTLLRIMLLGSSAVLLNIVALGIAALALILPGRRRVLAWVVVLVSFVLLFGVAGVVILSLLVG